MNDIILNKEIFDVSSCELPCLIHGENKSGASFFTMKWTKELVEAGQKVLFYSAFPQAKEFLLSECPDEAVVIKKPEIEPDTQLIIPESGNKKLFADLLNNKAIYEYVIILKNVEELELKTLKNVLKMQKVVLSGNWPHEYMKEALKIGTIPSRIYFSDLGGFLLDKHIELGKYQGYFVAKGRVGIKVD